jgi:hypothetical protein
VKPPPAVEAPRPGSPVGLHYLDRDGASITVTSWRFTLSIMAPVTVRNSMAIASRPPGATVAFLVEAVAVPSRLP